MSSPTTTQPAGGPDGAGRARQEIADFVTAVRSHLDDLAPDEVIELTGGLEADLADALAEEPDAPVGPAQRYGDPAEYARELRAAAGLPPRSTGRLGGPGGQAGRRRPVHGRDVEVLTRFYRETRTAVLAHPQWPAVRDFLIVLRPAWWVLRAWIAVQLLLIVGGAGDHLFRGGFGGFLLVLVAIVISVQLGRHSPFADNHKWLAIGAGNILAIVALLPIVTDSAVNHTYYATSDASYAPPPGLSVNGEQVHNVFPYDSKGQPLNGVQLYDQDGHPLEIGPDARSITDDDTGNTTIRLAPGSGPGTPPRWNIYPMQEQHVTQETDPNTGDIVDRLSPVQQAPVPFGAVPPLIAAPTPTATGTATPATTGPNATTTPVPTTTGGVPVPSKTTKPGVVVPSPSATTPK